VVGGSILVGVAVVPAQAAALVEALLAREDSKKKAQMTNDKRKFTTSSENLLALDTAKSCPKCGASFHWAKAQYCYSCGEEL
jgi:ribosomal protein S27AE